MSYPHSIVVDIDDCVSFTTNRDFDNATANTPLIEKLNDLYDQGWDVYYVTARGSLSCKTREEAKLKYKTRIEAWLNKHGCKYTELSFDKKLASYYIDDKAYKPDEFLDLQFKQFTTGLSGALTELRDNKVYKTANNTMRSIEWYSTAKSFFNVPQIYSVIGETICMEYIVDNQQEFNIFNIIEKIINREKLMPSLSAATFDSYIKRCEKHLSNIEAVDNKNDIVDLFKKYASQFEKYVSFSHGDLTVDNILCNNNKIYLIDPNFSPDLFSSYVLDIGKLLHSFRRYNRMFEYKTLLNYFDSINDLCILAELSHWIRLYKYADDELKQITVNAINELYGLFR